MHGPGAQPVRPRRGSAAAGAGRPGPRAGRVRGRPRAGGAGPAGAQPRAHRAARGRQDRAARRAALDGGPRGVGRREDRGAAGRRTAPAAVGRAAPGGPRPRRAPPRPGPRRGGPRRAQGVRAALAPDGAKMRDRWQPGIDVPVRNGRADSGDIEIDLVELFTEVAELAADVGGGVALLIDEMQDLRPDDVSALCAACHELSQSRAPLVVVGAGLPHLPAVLSASKSYSERLFRYVRIGQLDRADADLALLAPAEREDATSTTTRSTRSTRPPAATPTSSRPTARPPGTPRCVARSAPRTSGWRPRRRRPSWPSASSARATSGRRRPSASTCARWPS